MICPKCQAINPDAARFCRNCGMPMIQQTASEEPVRSPGNPAGNSYEADNGAYNNGQEYRDGGYAGQDPYYSQYPQNDPYYGGGYGSDRPPYQNPLIDRIRKAIESPLILTGNVFYTISLVLSLITSLGLGRSVQNILNNAFSQLGGVVPGLDSSISGSIQSASVAGTIISLIPTVLICIGMWLTFSAAKSRGPEMKTGGLTLIKVALVIVFVFVCIAIGLIFIALIAAFALVGSLAVSFGGISSDLASSGGTAALIVVIVILAVIAFLVILFFAKTIGTVNTVRKDLTGVPNRKLPSAFVGVLCIIGGILSGLGSFSIGSTASLGISGGIMGISVISSLLSAVFMILCGVIIFKLRSVKKACLEQNVF